MVLSQIIASFGYIKIHNGLILSTVGDFFFFVINFKECIFCSLQMWNFISQYHQYKIIIDLQIFFFKWQRKKITMFHDHKHYDIFNDFISPFKQYNKILTTDISTMWNVNN